MQAGCGPCGDIVPALNRMTPERDGVAILVINRGELDMNREWARSNGVRFPVLSQQGLELSRRYEVFATPFGFLIDEHGVIRSRGIVNTKQATKIRVSPTCSGCPSTIPSGPGWAKLKGCSVKLGGVCVCR